MKSKDLLSVLCLCAIVFCSGCKDKDPNGVRDARHTDTLAVVMSNTPENIIERGRYLTLIGGCADCHSPKKMTEMGPVLDIDKYMMGYPADRPLPKFKKADIPSGWIMMTLDETATIGPWGISYGANLTPDATGLGNWTYENFKTALIEGKYKGDETARTLMPPMPWQSIGQMKDDDMRAVFAYLQTLKPIENVVPRYTPLIEVK